MTTNPLALIIEDDPKLSELYDTVLKQSGYETEIIRRGDEALSRLATVSPVLILLDIHLPYVSGKEILQHIRADSRLAPVPVIVLTADLHIAKSLEEQANHVLIKSYGVSQLRNLIKRLRPADAPDPTSAASTENIS